MYGYDEDFCGYHGFDDYLIMGNLYNPQLPSLLKKSGLTQIQTNMKIVEHCQFEAVNKTSKISTHSISEPMMKKKIEDLDNNVYQHGSIIRFPWKIVKEYKIEESI